MSVNATNSSSGVCRNATGEFAQLCAVIEALQVKHESVQTSIDFAWILLTTMGILAMQAGFTLLEVGVVQQKNVKSVLMKNLCDFLFGAIVYWAFGYTLYQGDLRPEALFLHAGDAMGDTERAALQVDFMQQYAFAVTSVTIVSGTIMSRIRFEHYTVFSLIYMGVLYPICAHWSWKGFLADLGFVDFAGSGVVHMTGGFAGLTATWFLGPRVGRFVPTLDPSDPRVVRPLPPNCPSMTVQGVLLLFVSWFAFNCGSSAGLQGRSAHVASRSMVVTALGAAAGGSTAGLFSLVAHRQHNVSVICNGLLAGLVGITASAGMLDSWSAVVIGAVCALLFVPVSHVVLYRWGMDDPVDAFTIHGFIGAVSCLFQGVFDKQVGLVYTGRWDQMGSQVIGISVLCSFSVATTLVIFLVLEKCISGGIRIPDAAQVVGLDMSYHAGYDYPEFDHLAVQESNMQKEERARLVREGRKAYANKSRRTRRNRRKWRTMSHYAISSLQSDLKVEDVSSDGRKSSNLSNS